MKLKNTFVIILLINFYTITAYAHKPFFERNDTSFKNPFVVQDHKISTALYGELSNKNDVDYIRFSAMRGDTLHIQMAIPIIRENKDFNPTIALMGRGILQRDKVPFEIPDDFGVIVIPSGPSKYFHEKFTQTSYNIRQDIIGQIPADGEYYVAVYSPDRGGKYSLAIGDKEQFKTSDILSFPLIYLKVKSFFNPMAAIFIVIGGILLITGAIIILKLRWR